VATERPSEPALVPGSGLQSEPEPELVPGLGRAQPPARGLGSQPAAPPEPVPNIPGLPMGSELARARARARDNLEQALVPDKQALAMDKQALAMDSCLAAAKATRGSFAPWR
jgi:hypothetical protein